MRLTKTIPLANFVQPRAADKDLRADHIAKQVKNILFLQLVDDHQAKFEKLGKVLFITLGTSL